MDMSKTEAEVNVSKEGFKAKASRLMATKNDGGESSKSGLISNFLRGKKSQVLNEEVDKVEDKTTDKNDEQ